MIKRNWLIFGEKKHSERQTKSVIFPTGEQNDINDLKKKKTNMLDYDLNLILDYCISFCETRLQHTNFFGHLGTLINFIDIFLSLRINKCCFTQ